MYHLLFVFVLLYLPRLLIGIPQVERVQHGEVRFERSDAKLQIYASDGSIIHYPRFDIGIGETVDFLQPSSSSRVLNRIVSDFPSKIDGTLTSNGHLYLVNPAGIVFGSDAIVQTGNLFAAAGKMQDGDFLAGKNVFSDLSGRIVNSGKLRGDAIHLVGKAIENNGIIDSQNGYVSVSSGDSVWIQERGSRFFIELQSGQSDGIGASDWVGLAISHKGSIRSKAAHIEGDSVFIEGDISCSGGTITILGNEIELRTAKIDASGKEGGGGNPNRRGFSGQRISSTIQLHENRSEYLD